MTWPSSLTVIRLSQSLARPLASFHTIFILSSVYPISDRLSRSLCAHIYVAYLIQLNVHISLEKTADCATAANIYALVLKHIIEYNKYDFD